MTAIKQAAQEFLACHRIAVTGVSRTPAGHGGNVIADRLRERGYEVVAVNPNAAQIGGRPAYPNLAAIPGGVEAVVIATAASRALATMEEAATLGIEHVWMHRASAPGSVSAEATAFGREHGIQVIDGGCPLMFDPVSDGGHKFMCLIGQLSGAVPRQVA
jgi:predicted CoA-binding protein